MTFLLVERGKVSLNVTRQAVFGSASLRLFTTLDEGRSFVVDTPLSSCSPLVDIRPSLFGNRSWGVVRKRSFEMVTFSEHQLFPACVKRATSVIFTGTRNLSSARDD
jgi:hypothetical protein